MKTKVLTLTGLAAALALGSISCSKQQAQQGGMTAPQIAVMTIEPTTAMAESSYPVTLKGKTTSTSAPR